VLRKHPVALATMARHHLEAAIQGARQGYRMARTELITLATMARHHLEAAIQGARQGYRMARTELTDALPPHAVNAVLTAYRREARRLVAAARGVDAVEQALRGEPRRQRTNPPATRPRWPEQPEGPGWQPRPPGN
jgi:hypothetical protein